MATSMSLAISPASPADMSNRIASPESITSPQSAAIGGASLVGATAVVPDKIIGSSTSFEVYEPFRNLLAKRENEYSLILSFFSEKLAVEAAYIKENEKLLKKFSTLNLSNGKTTSLALSSYMEFNNAQQEERIRYKDQILSVTQSLEDLKKAIDASSRQLKDVVKPVARKYTEVASITIPKMKAAYCKKLETWEKDSVDTTISGQKLFKINKDAEIADSAYRSSIVELEEIRINLEQVKQKAAIMWEVMERQRGEFLSSCLKNLSTSLNDSHAHLLDKLKVFNQNSEAVSFEEDCKLAVDYFLLAFPEREPILFEHHKSKEGAKDLVFGVSLEHALRTSSKNGLPHLLHYCFQAIESRGLEKQGIYRLSAKKNELIELKAKVETNVHSIPYMSEDIDIHLLTGLVKLYLREMPIPIFLFAAKDRAEYSANPVVEERIFKLTAKVKALVKVQRTILEAVIMHLHKVYMKCSINKMTIPNLSMIFSAVLFQGQEQAAPEPSSMTSMFFSKTANPTVDMAALELLKNDLVIEDMIKYSDQIFKEAPFSKWIDESGTASMTNSPSLPELASPTTAAGEESVLDEVKSLPPLPPRANKSNDSLPIQNNVAPQSETVNALGENSSPYSKVTPIDNPSPILSPQMSPSIAGGNRGSRSFFVKLGAGIKGKAVEKEKEKASEDPQQTPRITSLENIQNIGTIGNDSPMSGILDEEVGGKELMVERKTTSKPSSVMGLNMSRQQSIKSIKTSNNDSTLTRHASKRDSEKSGPTTVSASTEKLPDGSQEKLALPISTITQSVVYRSMEGMNASADSLPGESSKVPKKQSQQSTHSRGNHSIISFLTQSAPKDDDAASIASKSKGGMKDRVKGIFGRRGSQDHLKLDSHANDASSCASPTSVRGESPMMSPPAPLITKSSPGYQSSLESVDRTSGHGKAKASLYEPVVLPTILGTPNEKGDGALSDLLADVMSGLSTSTSNALDNLASSPTTRIGGKNRKGGLKKGIPKTKKMAAAPRKADDEDYIDESLVADVQANLYDIDNDEENSDVDSE